jgi:hypothetical protein
MMQNKLVQPYTGRQHKKRKKLTRNHKRRKWKEIRDWRLLPFNLYKFK